MALKSINLVQVICDRCDTSVLIKNQQDAKKLGWNLDNQLCPDCSFEKTDFAAQQAKNSNKACPLSLIEERMKNRPGAK